MKSVNNFFDSLVSLESTVKLCDELWESLHNMHHKVPKELEPRLVDFLPKMHRYRVESYKVSLIGGAIGLVCAMVLIFLGSKFDFDGMLPALLCVLAGASSGLILMGYRRAKENFLEQRATNRYKSALDDYYAKHRVESFVASMKSANIVTACCNNITEVKKEATDILVKLYALGNIPEESRNFETMCAALVCAKAMVKVKTPETVLKNITDAHHRKSEYEKSCISASKIASQICDALTNDEAYNKLKVNVEQLMSDCRKSNDDIKKEFSLD